MEYPLRAFLSFLAFRDFAIVALWRELPSHRSSSDRSHIPKKISDISDNFSNDQQKSE
jgi:hypothetical protein